MQDYSFTYANGAQPSEVLAAVEAVMPPDFAFCGFMTDNLLHVMYFDDVAVPDSAVASAAGAALAVQPLVSGGDTALAAVEAQAAAIGADTVRTTVTDARIDALEQRLDDALRKIASLLGA